MSRYKNLSADWTREILYSLRLCVADPDTIVLSKDYLGVRKEEPALQCRRQICAPDTSSLKPGSGATEGVLDKGVLGHPDYGTWAGLMGCEDTRPKTLSRVRMGLSLVWKASLATGYVDSFICNRPCVTLDPPGVYINRRT